MAPLMVGAFYNSHLGAELARADGIDHLAMADPPAPHDPHWPAIKQRYTLLLHDYLGQLSEPLDERSIARARSLAELYRTPRSEEHTSELQSRSDLVCRLLLEKKKHKKQRAVVGEHN